jgi:hypothetical protein
MLLQVKLAPDATACPRSGLAPRMIGLELLSCAENSMRMRPRPNAICNAWDCNAADIDQRIALIVVARSPIERLVAWKRERSWLRIGILSWITAREDGLGAFIEPLRENSGAG